MSITFTTIAARDTHTTISTTILNLLIALLVLLIVSVLLVAALLYFRQRRRIQKTQLHLPLYNEKHASTSSISSHRRVMIRPSEPIYVVQEKQSLTNNSDSPPPSPVPEIRITFPEEIDDAGKRRSGRVVVVRVGESSIGLEPVAVDNLPSYEQEGGRFQSLDMDRIGGLMEKDYSK